MSLLGNATLANPATAYYGGGGGGGGGASTVTNTLAVDIITPLAPATAVQFNGTVNMDNSLVYVSSLTTANTSGDVDMGAGLSWSGSNGTLVGVSSINGAPVLPRAAPLTLQGAPIQVTTGPGQVSTILQFSTTIGKAYLLGGNGQLQFVPGGTVNDGQKETCTLADGGGTFYPLGQYPNTTLSTLAGVGGLSFGLNCAWIATSSGAAVQVSNNHGAGETSTSLAVAAVALIDLGPA